MANELPCKCCNKFHLVISFQLPETIWCGKHSFAMAASKMSRKMFKTGGLAAFKILFHPNITEVEK